MSRLEILHRLCEVAALGLEPTKGKIKRRVKSYACAQVFKALSPDAELPKAVDP